jgi:AbrB family transcriptional regulator (stage V sporulation protein T)
MKATGIVRKIDNLGRVVIPVELRRTLHIHEGDPMEIYTDGDGEVIFKKYSPLGEMGSFAAKFADALHRTSGFPVLVCDRDRVIAAAGIPKKETLERRVSSAFEDIMERRKPFLYANCNDGVIRPVEGVDRVAIAGAVIVTAGDVRGAVMLLGNDAASIAGDAEMLLVSTAAVFLGGQMEE